MRFERLILALGTVAAAGMGSAAYALDPLDAITVCSRITKADARVECYDQVARDAASGVLQRSTPAPAPQSSLPQGVSQQGWTAPPIGGAAAPRPQAQAQAPAAGFGAQDLRRQEGADGPESMRAEVASSTDNGLGLWRIRLADGAIWQMTERNSMFRPPAPKEVITIRKGALGSFLMDVGQQGSVRVRRVH